MLVERYLEEMQHAIGRQADRDLCLLAGVEVIWDSTTADLAQKQVERHRANTLPLVKSEERRPRTRGRRR